MKSTSGDGVLTRSEAIALLRERVAQHGGINEAGRQMGVTPAAISRVLKHGIKLPPAVSRAIGLSEREESYERVDKTRQ